MNLDFIVNRPSPPLPYRPVELDNVAYVMLYKSNISDSLSGDVDFVVMGILLRWWNGAVEDFALQSFINLSSSWDQRVGSNVVVCLCIYLIGVIIET